jgi:DNA-binding MarR family transcriptional regulator
VTESERVAARAQHMLGVDAQALAAGNELLAWEGLLEVSRRLRRGAEELLIAGFDLSISMLGITGRLRLAPAQTLRQTALAEAMGLSVSRVSRVIDLLERRQLVQRRPCPEDARATNVVLTRDGAGLTARAQHDLSAYVESGFFAHLQPQEAATLAAVFARILDHHPVDGETACEGAGSGQPARA